MVLQVSIGQISDDDDEIIGSITSAALAVLSLQDGQQRPHSALDSSMSDAQKIAAGKFSPKTFKEMDGELEEKYLVLLAKALP